MTGDVEQLKSKLVESGSLTREQVDTKVQEKLSSLGGLISEEGAIHIVANENNIRLGKPPSSELKLKNVLTGMRNVTVVAKVLRKYEPRNFGTDNEGRVASLFMGDETSFMRLTFWNDKVDNIFNKISEQDVIEVQHAYSKENNGYVELHMGNSSDCVVNPEGKSVTVKERSNQQMEEKKLKDVTEDDKRLMVTATIVQAYDPRFFESCPQCGKRLQQKGETYICPRHGEQTPTYNYVMNLFLDDGTDNMRAAVWKDQIHQLLQKEESEVMKLKDDKEKLEQLKTDLLGTIIQAKGRARKNTVYNNIELVLFEVNPDPNPATAASSSSSSESQETTTEKKEQASQTASATSAAKTEKQDTKESEQSDGASENAGKQAASEESVSGEDDELPSIDDIDDNV